MAANSSIEWTEASWPVTTGCKEVSDGCDHCYAATMTAGPRSGMQGRIPDSLWLKEMPEVVGS